MADSNTPSWLSPESNVVEPLPSAPVATDSGNGVIATQSPPNASVTASTTTTAAAAASENPELPSMILVMRLGNMGAALLMIVCSILYMISIPSISGFVLAVYATCGGLLICCLETQLKFIRVLIAMNFGFLFHSIWRFFFYILLGSIMWSFNQILGKVTAIVFFAVAIFNTYVLCRYPEYKRLREKIAEEEDKRIEARISKEVKRQAAAQMGFGNK
jgi:hypothetical protein